MIGVLETCGCGREFLRGIYPQKKCYVCTGTQGNLNFWVLVDCLLRKEKGRKKK